MKRSGAQQLQFRDAFIMPILGSLMEKKLSYPEINDRVRKQDELIAQRFRGKKVHITLRGFYSPLSPLVRAAAGIENNGDPGIIVYLPAIMDQYEAGSFECSFMRSIMHERDHLTEMVKSNSRVDLENETHVHALTAEFVLIPLIGKYKQTCSSNDLLHYTAWINSGRNEKSPIWWKHMKGLYGLALDFK